MTPGHQRRRVAARAFAAAFIFLSAPRASAYPSMSSDFKGMMEWLSGEMVQGLAFNAGSTFDPPREIVDRRLEPDLSVGIGHLPLDKSKFPEPETPGLKDYNTQEIFPASTNFPNLAMHLRAGLPGRFDVAIRAADMTTPPGYKISPTTTGVGQSNSLGASLRRHFLGGDLPLLSVGAHFNHVYGRFEYKTKINIEAETFSADANVNGGLYWNVNSYGLNAVLSQTYGSWTPFMGVGYNYVTGSVRSKLEAVANTFLVGTITGEASREPEQTQGRVIMGAQLNYSWVNFFTNAEIKALGIGAGKTWIVQTGFSLPFRIGPGGGPSSLAAKRARKADRELVDAGRPARPKRVGPAPREMFTGSIDERVDGTPTMIFIQ
jgi:hypothetical protein